MRMTVWVTAVALVLAGCADRTQMPLVPDSLAIGRAHTVFATTTRKREADGTFGFARSPQLQMTELTVSIPPSHTPGELSYSHTKPDPNSDFVLAEDIPIPSVADLSARLAREQSDNHWPLREVTIFVHGYNSTFPETAYRAAQIAHDVDLPGSLLIYSWPSRGQGFGYAYDLDSILFARNGLEETIRRVKAAGAQRIVLAAHSMGTALAMEMLRQAELKSPGWAARTLNGGVLLIAPDIDVDLFESQLSDLKHVPEPFTVMVSEKDTVLNISGRLRGTDQGQRLGNIKSAQRFEAYPIEVIDLTDFNTDAASKHFVAATSPSLIAMIRSANEVDQAMRSSDPSLLGQILKQDDTVTLDAGKLRLERQSRSADR